MEASDFASTQKRLSELSLRLVDRAAFGASRTEVAQGKTAEHQAALETVPAADRREKRSPGESSRPEDSAVCSGRHPAPVEL